MARVVFESLTKVFQGPKGERVVALDRFSLVVEDKELLVLVGPSGCGKTTTLRLIAGLEQPTSGSVSIDGQSLKGIPPGDRDVAMVFQNPALYPHMSVFANLAFGLTVRRTPRPEIERRVNEAAELLGLTPYLDHLPMALSGGQRQRVALGRALVRRPKVFLFDEPLSDLDPQLRAQLRVEIINLRRRTAATLIYVTHDHVEAMSLGDRVAVMRQGALQQVAAALELYQQPANLFVAGFIGSPPMNFLPGSIINQGQALWFKGESELPADGIAFRIDNAMPQALGDFVGRQVILGVRPEDIEASALETRPGQTIEALIEALEATGPELHLHLRAGGHSFVAREPATAHVKVGQRVAVVFNVRSAHYFDPVTEKRIS